MSQTILNFHGTAASSGPWPPHYRGFTFTLRHTTLGRTPLDEWSARRRDLYLTLHDTHKRYISMPSAGYKPAIPTRERQQNHALGRESTGTGSHYRYIMWLCVAAWLSALGTRNGLYANTRDQRGIYWSHVLYDEVINSVAKSTDIVTLRWLSARQTWESFWIETQTRSQSFLRELTISLHLHTCRRV
jgi:hypothetical protein